MTVPSEIQYVNMLDAEPTFRQISEIKCSVVLNEKWVNHRIYLKVSIVETQVVPLVCCDVILSYSDD